MIPQEIVDFKDAVFAGDIRHFLAPTDGVTNAAPFITDAIDDRAGAPVTMPPGTFKISEVLQYITTSTSTYVAGLQLVGSGMGVTIIDASAADLDAAIDVDTNAVGVYRIQRHVLFKDFTLLGRGKTNPGVNDGHGIRVRHAQFVEFDHVNVISFPGDNYHFPVTEGDNDGCTYVRGVQSNSEKAGGWGINADLVAHNEFSYLIWENSRVDDCGILQALTYAAGTGTVACTAGVATFSTSQAAVLQNGYFITVAAVEYIVSAFNGTTSATLRTVTGTTPTFGATAFTWLDPTPTSGGIRFKGQFCSFRDGGMTLCENAGFYLYGRTVLGIAIALDHWTFENCKRTFMYCEGVNGLHWNRVDARTNNSYPATRGLWLRSSIDSLVSVVIEGTDVNILGAANNGFTMFDADGAQIRDLHIAETDWRSFDTSVLTKYGNGLFAAVTGGLYIEDEGRVRVECENVVHTVYTSANPTYTPDATLAPLHTIQLDAGTTGSLTLATPTLRGMADTVANGLPLHFFIRNSSGATVGLLGYSGVNISRIANGAIVSFAVMYNRQLGEWYGWQSGYAAVFPLTDAATIAIDARDGPEYTVTLAGNRTMGAPTNPANGQRIEIVVIQDATGGRTLAWNAVFKQAWSDTGNTTLKRSSIVFAYDGTNWNQIGAQSPYI